jgi:heme-degrading monooxygenase HmoA
MTLLPNWRLPFSTWRTVLKGIRMVVRVWKGRASAAHADAYQTHVTTAVFPKLGRIAGFLGGRVLRRDIGEEVEFMVATEWASLDAIRVFAGTRPEVAVVEPEARSVLTQFDEHVEHFVVAHECRG